MPASRNEFMAWVMPNKDGSTNYQAYYILEGDDDWRKLCNEYGEPRVFASESEADRAAARAVIKSLEEMKTPPVPKWVIACGDVARGFQFCGPFPDQKMAFEFASKNVEMDAGFTVIELTLRPEEL